MFWYSRCGHTTIPLSPHFDRPMTNEHAASQFAADMRYSSQTIASGSAGVAPRAGDKAVYKLVRTSRLYEQIVQQIEESIVKGALKPGDQLPAERELAQRFGVSRTAVREAVKALREKGLVEAYSGRGTFITDGTSQAVRQSLDLITKIGQPEGSHQLAEVRAILEPEIAALAAIRIQEPELATMREAVAVMDRAGSDPDAYIEADVVTVAPKVGGYVVGLDVDDNSHRADRGHETNHVEQVRDGERRPRVDILQGVQFRTVFGPLGSDCGEP